MILSILLNFLKPVKKTRYLCLGHVWSSDRIFDIPSILLAPQLYNELSVDPIGQTEIFNAVQPLKRSPWKFWGVIPALLGATLTKWEAIALGIFMQIFSTVPVGKRSPWGFMGIISRTSQMNICPTQHIATAGGFPFKKRMAAAISCHQSTGNKPPPPAKGTECGDLKFAPRAFQYEGGIPLIHRGDRSLLRVEHRPYPNFLGLSSLELMASLGTDFPQEGHRVCFHPASQSEPNVWAFSETH
ncbi:hypothetical protein DFH07DRAFT_781591 [Mycena maculata]|uniref:Uncharacterized protein n=1 Tax=Mycena maculata TaxID=230809 RepID=A0AAD7MU14_9AGAR|nr:hypothetical protein DFH07DRAFT_781591 [Mycena maculata]